MANLKCFIVERDEQDNLLSEKVAGKFSVIVDPATETTEIIRINAVDIRALYWNEIEGVFQMQIALGGYDSSGKFYPAPQIEGKKWHKPALVSWGSNDTRWQTYGLDSIEGKTKNDYRDWLHRENCVTRAAKTVWGIKGMTSQYQGAYARQPKEG